MNDNVFIDTNIIVFAYSITEPEKQKRARQIITQANTFISTQVLQELANILRKKFKLSFPEIEKTIEECRQNNITHINTEGTLLQACKIADRYGFSFYDSVIISAGLESDCKILYTEDMNHGQVIDNKLKIVNPFL